MGRSDSFGYISTSSTNLIEDAQNQCTINNIFSIPTPRQFVLYKGGGGRGGGGGGRSSGGGYKGSSFSSSKSTSSSTRGTLGINSKGVPSARTTAPPVSSTSSAPTARTSAPPTTTTTTTTTPTTTTPKTHTPTPHQPPHAPTHPNPTPGHAPRPYQPHPQQHPSMMQQPPKQGIVSKIVDGMTFGVGNSLGRRAVDSIFGPRTFNVHHSGRGGITDGPSGEYAPPPPMASLHNSIGLKNYHYHTRCATHFDYYNRCMQLNNNDADSCTDYSNALEQCKQSIE